MRALDESYRVPKRPPPVNRKCLRCDKTFTAAGRFNRVCKGCKGDIAWTSAQPDYTLPRAKRVK